MPRTRRLRLLLVLCALGPLARVRGDTVVMKNGAVYRGTVDHDNTIYFIFDGLKRVIVRDSKIEKRTSDASFRNQEVFKLEQPLVVHTGAMPKDVLSVEAEPWTDRGRRMFSYVGSSLKKVSMEQAINELGPHLVKIRGVDGFWQGQLATNQVPRAIVLGILAKVDRKNYEERRRVYTFLVQAEWYTEAKQALDDLARDFPDRRDQIANARAYVVQLEASQLKAEIEVRRKAQQPFEVLGRLKTFPSKDIDSELLIEVRDAMRRDEAQAAADRALAESLRALSERLPEVVRERWQRPVLELLQALKEAPDAVRDRFVAWQKANAAAEKDKDGESLFALAVSGYVVGADAAVADLEAASSYWKARDVVREYLASPEPDARAALLEQLQEVQAPDDPPGTPSFAKLDVITRLAERMPPPLDDENGAKPGAPRVHRVALDDNAEPTDYGVLLPPEYHPLRTYPTVVALHAGGGPKSALAWWGAEAARRGYIVIAPEYNLPGQPSDYRFSTSEHAAVELALRDARRRYAIDCDRVFLGGSLTGGHMAWDYGLAHPDLFAGVAILSGLPLKYAIRYLPEHAERLPLYIVLGDLAPASNEVVFSNLVRPLIAKGFDTTYVEYFKRGLEDLPEEAPAVFDWMDRRKPRDPYPKTFEVISARDSDDRFHGVVIREFTPGRTTAPEAVEQSGKNLNPASIKLKTSALSNLLNYQTVGLKAFDVWVGPKQLDFKKRMEIRINGKALFKGMPKPSFSPFLEDLRIRGDRRQTYWLKASVG